MCSHYGVNYNENLFRSRFLVDDTMVKNFVEAEIYPGRNSLVILNEGDKRILRTFEWGFRPTWAKTKSMRIFNSRIETIQEKQSFNKLLVNNKCLIIGNYFYEWESVDGKKQPRKIGLKEKGLFAFAGLWDTYKSESGEIKYATSMITLPPNDFMVKIHNRMPAILEIENEAAWLNSAGNASLAFIKPYPNELMRFL